MITLRQIEALHWIERLGTFERAAARLNTTQSAVSKRMQELEASLDMPLFDRRQRGSRLTEMGEQVLVIGRQMLDLAEQMHSLKDGPILTTRRLRLGATDLSALTWLPRLVNAIRDRFPHVVIEPEVDMSRNLYERLMDEALDLIIIPDAFTMPEVTSVKLAKVTNAWMARPGLVDSERCHSLIELAEYPIVIQGGRSGSGLYVNKWLRSHGVELKTTISTDNLTAALGLTAAGLGISYLPRECFQPLVDAGTLMEITVNPELPQVPYVAMYRNDRPSDFVQTVAQLAQEVCDFSRQLQS
jgi:DNA-binding transcriptional LysR family regulator